jgi:uncharacterized protein with FMN-binding domain
MRRSPYVITATVAGTAGLLAFHPHAAAVRPASARPASIAGARTATGDAIPTRYGDVQVRVGVKAGKIVDVQAVQLTADDPRSVEISAAAAPTLRQEALSRQSAAIDAVSGATFTSEGYAQSLQSALDKLGFKAR